MQTLRILALIAFFSHAGCSEESPPTNTETIVASDTSAEDAEWYFLVLNLQIGPLRESELREEAARGRFRRDAQVWTESLGEWQNLDTALPGITIGGSEEDGETWTRIFRRKALVPEPMIPARRVENALTPSEIRQYLQQSNQLLEEMRTMPGRYGPELDLKSAASKSNDGRLGLGRELARLLRHDIEDAVAKGDKDRAIADIKALCALTRQMAISVPYPREGRNTSEEYFSYPRLVSLANVRIIAAIIVKPENAIWADDFKSTAREHLGWIDPMLRNMYLEDQQERKEARQRKNIQLNSEALAIQAMTMELMGGS